RLSVNCFSRIGAAFRYQGRFSITLDTCPANTDQTYFRQL
ncbi:MAG: hypothetical protein RLZZ387_3341, partial [Chloroflexota bacterium]